MNYGFIKVSAAVPKLKVADCEYNAREIVKLIKKADVGNSKIIVFPELSITAYTCDDLFHQDILLQRALEGLFYILKRTSEIDIISIVGIPLRKGINMYNCAVIIHKGVILGIVPKSHIPNHKEYYEARWFQQGIDINDEFINVCGSDVPFGTDLLFVDENDNDICFGIEICEDLWVPVPPSCFMALAGANIVFNLSASNEIIGKYEYRKDLINQQSARCICGYVYTSAGVYESTNDLVFSGHAIITENGVVLKESARFLRNSNIISSEIDLKRLVNERIKITTFQGKTKKFKNIKFRLSQRSIKILDRIINPYPFVPSNSDKRNEICNEIFNIQIAALAKRFEYTGVDKGIIGVSGGLDSTLALLVTVETFNMLGINRKNIIAVTMPGFGTSGITFDNAIKLIEELGVTMMKIDIKEACNKHFSDIGHDGNKTDLTYENTQARERTQILMDIATMKNGMVIGTGDLSELALGWCTYNGDHMSMYSINASIPKTLVKYLIEWVAENYTKKLAGKVLKKILNTPISPELLPTGNDGEITQKTEDIIGPYELHDFYLYHLVRYGAKPDKILFLARKAFNEKYGNEELKKYLKIFLKRFFSQQFKRTCQPAGPKVGTINLSPRGDWRMPSDAEVNNWINQV